MTCPVQSVTHDGVLISILQEFFGQLDQRVLNTFLKACDELTDILPEQEQQSLQETVRKLHKHWKVGALSFFKVQAERTLQKSHGIYISMFLKKFYGFK